MSLSSRLCYNSGMEKLEFLSENAQHLTWKQLPPGDGVDVTTVGSICGDEFVWVRFHTGNPSVRIGLDTFFKFDTPELVMNIVETVRDRLNYRYGMHFDEFVETFSARES